MYVNYSNMYTYVDAYVLNICPFDYSESNTEVPMKISIYIHFICIWNV